MALKGSIVKSAMMAEILKTFPNSFTPDNKEIRVDTEENGNPIQIKITLTAVKSPITNNPEIQIVNEKQFFLTDEEKANLDKAMEEAGVRV